jgi:guanylate kinase
MKDILITLTGISGSGKTTLLKKLEDNYAYHKVITCTTRDPRVDDNEKDGIDYYFLNKEEFKLQSSKDRFAENEEFDGNFYGTRWSEITCDKTIPVAILEPKGAQNLSELLKSNNYEVIKVFIDCPPEVAIERITKRDGGTPEKLEKRINSIKTKETDWDTYDYDIKLALGSTLEEVNELITGKIIEIQKKNKLESKVNSKIKNN